MDMYEIECEDLYQDDDDDMFYDTFTIEGEEEGDDEEDEELEEFEIDPGMWHKHRLELTTNDELQDMERTRINLLVLGEQYDVLPHLRCYNCAKVIGNLWEPFLEYAKEKAYEPEDVIDILDLNEDQKSTLVGALDDPIFFDDLLVEFDVKDDFETLMSQRKYTNKEIFDDKLKIKPCCRSLFVGPIHVPIKQSAFTEPQKTTKIQNPLIESSEDLLQLSFGGEEDEPDFLDDEEDDTIPLIPSILPEEDLGACEIPTPLQVVSAAQFGAVDEDLDLEDEDLAPLEAPVKRVQTLIPVGKEYSVPQQPRIYRAR